ncbi:MAG: Rrf2 family transcriptional regulator [Aquificaceae bacterium]
MSAIWTSVSIALLPLFIDGLIFELFRISQPAYITIMDVIMYLDEDYKLDYCVLRPGRCEEWNTTPCSIHEKWTDLRKAILDYLNTTTIAELAEVEEKHRAPI